MTKKSCGLRWIARIARFLLLTIVCVISVAGGALFPTGVESAPRAASPLPGWQRAGAKATGAVTLITDLSQPGTLAALGAPVPDTDIRTQVRRTSDGGRTWLIVDRGLPLDLRLISGTFLPDDPRGMMVSGVGGLYQLASEGTRWERLRVHLPPVTALIVDRANPRRILAGTELRGNFMSEDRGETWFEASIGLPRDRYGTLPGGLSFAQSFEDPNVLLMAGSITPGAWRSVNGGRTWRAIATGLPPGATTAVTFHPNGLAFVAGERGLSLSVDRGQTWNVVTALPDQVQPVCIVVEPGQDSWIVVGARGAVLRTTNRGKNWVELPGLPRPIGGVVALPPFSADGAPTVVGGTRVENVPQLIAAAAGSVWTLAVPPTTPASPATAAQGGRYVAATEHNLSPRFAVAYDRLGGFDRFGYPRTELFLEGGLLVQWFQRGRLEFRPDLEGTAYEVQISLLGDLLLSDHPTPQDPEETTPERRYFPETGFTVANAFLRYFEARGGVDSLGYPITPEVTEADRPVQYFQRARLEYRKEFGGTAREVQIGLIGDELLQQRRWLE